VWHSSELPPRQGIVAESPQEAHRRFRGLAAESPVFLPVFGQKKAPKNMGIKIPVVFILPLNHRARRDPLD
jgi:hypothetical protein